MSQIPRRFTYEQVRVLFNGYCHGWLGSTEIQELRDIAPRMSVQLHTTGIHETGCRLPILVRGGSIHSGAIPRSAPTGCDPSEGTYACELPF